MARRIARRIVVLAACALGLMAGCSSWFGPTVDFDASAVEGLQPLVVQFTPTSEEPIVACSWTFGDGATSDEVDPVHIYRTAGTYSVTLTAEFVDGTVAQVEKPDVVTVSMRLAQGKPAMIYWTTGRGVRRTPRAGGDTETVIEPSSHVFNAIAVADGWVYWADATSHTIHRARTDGTEEETLITGQQNVSDLEVVPGTNVILWAVHPSEMYNGGDVVGGIYMAFLDQREPLTLIAYEPGARRYADQIEVDAAGNRLYWTMEYYNPKWPSALATPQETSCREAIRYTDLSGFRPHSLQSEMCDVLGLAIDAIPGYPAEHVYWTDQVLGSIDRCRIDGTAKQLVVDQPMRWPELVAVDRLEGKLYWTDRFGLHRANLNGSGRELVVDKSTIVDIALPEGGGP